MPNKMAPSPDGFIIAFYQSCWNIIKEELLAAFASFVALDGRSLEKINSAYLILLPKIPTLANQQILDQLPWSIVFPKSFWKSWPTGWAVFSLGLLALINLGKLDNNFIINSRILSMTNTSTNMLNTNIVDILSNMNRSNIHGNISIEKQFGIRRTYRTVVEEAEVDADRFTTAKRAVMLLTMMLVVKTGRSRRR